MVDEKAPDAIEKIKEETIEEEDIIPADDEDATPEIIEEDAPIEEALEADEAASAMERSVELDLFGGAVLLEEARVSIYFDKLNDIMLTLEYPPDPEQDGAVIEEEASQVLYCFNTNPETPYIAQNAGGVFSEVQEDGGIASRPQDIETLKKFHKSFGSDPSDWAYNIEKYLMTVVKVESVKCFNKEKIRTYYNYLRNAKNVFSFICMNMDRHLQLLYAHKQQCATDAEKDSMQATIDSTKSSNAYKQAFALRAFFTEVNFCYFYRHRLRDRAQLERIYKKNVYLSYGIYISYLTKQDEEIAGLLKTVEMGSEVHTRMTRLNSRNNDIYQLGYFNVYHFICSDEDNVLGEMSYEYSDFVPFVRYTTLPKVFTMNLYSTNESIFSAYKIPAEPDFYALKEGQNPLEKQPILSRVFSLLRSGPKIMFDRMSRIEFKRSLQSLEKIRSENDAG